MQFPRWQIAFTLLLATLAVSVRADERTRANKDEKTMKKLRLYIGTYTGEKSKGIYRVDLDLVSGEMRGLALAGEVANPSFLAIHPGQKFLYVVSEIGDFNGQKTGAVAALAIEPKTGNLKLLNIEPCGGAGPCHIVTDKAGKNVLVANYSGGSAAVLPIKADGSLAKMSSLAQHEGSGVNEQRQQAPHAHSINLDAANRFAFVADLGLDQVLVYRFDGEQGTITPNDPPYAQVAEGAGPRHFAFHPDGTKAYVINEMLLTVTAFKYDPKKGTLTELQTVSTLPGKRQAGDSTAEIVVHPSGKFLYGSNRGHNSIAVFAIDERGVLKLTGHATEGIKTPRNFAVDPTGKYLIVANQDGDSLTLFAIDQKTGALEPTGKTIEVPMPVCIRMLPIE